MFKNKKMVGSRVGNWNKTQMEVLQKLANVRAPLIAGDARKPWKVSKLQTQGPAPMLISQANLPTNKQKNKKKRTIAGSILPQ